jgi:hypothetical protein
MSRSISLVVLAFAGLAACSSSKSDGAAPSSSAAGAGGAAGAAGAGGGAAGGGPVDRQGDLGPLPAAIVHGGAVPGGTGAVTTPTWAAVGCGDVPVAMGVTDVAWSSESYDDAGAGRSPYAVHTSFRFDTSSSVSVIWGTGPGTRASMVAIGDSPDKLDRFAAGVSFTYSSTVLEHAAPMRVHEAHLCGLMPDRTYYYAVGGDGYWGAVHAFKTAPAPANDAPFRIGVFGDSNNVVYSDFKVVVDRMKAEAPDFIAFSGDLVHDGAIQTQWDAWFEASGDLFASSPIMAAHGNHEAMATAYFAQFAQPGNEEYYSFDYGNAHFVVLNDTPPDDAEFAVQAKFLEADLAAAVARPTPPRWLVAMHHRPPYTSSGESFANPLTYFTPIYDKYHVDLVINGHEHCYESTKPIKNGVAVPTYAEGTFYLTTGGAGGLLNLPTFTQAAWSRTYKPVYNYVTIDVAGPKLTVHAYANDGSLLEDPIVIQK